MIGRLGDTLFALCVLSVLHMTVESLSVLKESCAGETLAAACPAEDQVLVVRSAVYGRMRASRCVRAGGGGGGHDGGHPVCQSNVLRLVDRVCSGRRSCRVHVADSVFGNPAPCHQSVKTMYLEVVYECLKVTMPTRSSDCSTEKLLTINQPFGYLSNFVAEEYGYGSVLCPWRIALSTGERLNITLIDFYAPQAADSRRAGAEASSSSSTGFHQQHCPLYALLTESSSTPHSFRVCGGDRRERNVFISRTNVVEVKIMKRPMAMSMADKDVYFLLQFEAIGCPEPATPRFGWSLRDGDGVLMGCNHSRLSWRLSCDGSRWVGGHLEACSAVVESSEKPLMVWGNVSIPFTVSLIVMVALAVIAVIIILLISLLCIEWQKGSETRLRSRSKLVSGDESSTGSGPYDPRQHQPPASNHHKTPNPCSLSTDRLDPSASSPSSSSSQAAVRNVDPKADGASTHHRPANDYVKEMWPMVAVAQGNPGAAVADPQPANNGGGSSSSTTFFHQYVDLGSLALTSSSSCGGGVAQNGGGRGRCQSMLITDSEDDTHIYETPKYLRREKATTMRLKGLQQPQQPQQQPQQTTARYASATLPKEFGCGVNKAKRTQ